MLRCQVYPCQFLCCHSTVPAFSLTRPVANKRELNGDTAVPRRGLLDVPRRRGGIVSADHDVKRAPNRRSGGASDQRLQDQRVASVICSAHDGQPERGHTG